MYMCRTNKTFIVSSPSHFLLRRGTDLQEIAASGVGVSNFPLPFGVMVIRTWGRVLPVMIRTRGEFCSRVKMSAFRFLTCKMHFPVI